MSNTDLEVFVITDECPRLSKRALTDIAMSLVNILDDFGVRAEVEITARTTTRTTATAGEVVNDE